MDPRHLKRIRIIQNLYALSFNNKTVDLPYPKELETEKILAKLDKIDRAIERYASRYPLDKIARVDLAILRMSIYDLIYLNETPKKVVIDEAVLLAKELSGEKSYAFVNAILGKIVGHEKS